MGRSLALPIVRSSLRGNPSGLQPLGRFSSPPFIVTFGRCTSLPLWAPWSRLTVYTYGLNLALPTAPSPEPSLNYSRGARRWTSYGGAFVVEVIRALLSLTVGATTRYARYGDL
jgi:hypothetical protein